MLFKERLPHWSESDFRNIENITSGMELSALTAPCDRYYTLKDKIKITIDSMLKIFEIPKEERENVLEKIEKFDCEKIGNELFEKFVNRLKIEED